ncbi:hypothetical protein HMPREF1316_0991 [Olsenella profusa F0195]|uniref:Uncharacterized protein n=1 Tax=Olsenella profusa F0195 TaxID=1125712 RepID=U2TKD0_9ACTN|nr:hypothetical protein HMPREF1316_0991 [Olsenella profusa F0195]
MSNGLSIGHLGWGPAPSRRHRDGCGNVGAGLMYGEHVTRRERKMLCPSNGLWRHTHGAYGIRLSPKHTHSTRMASGASAPSRTRQREPPPLQPGSAYQTPTPCAMSPMRA